MENKRPSKSYFKRDSSQSDRRESAQRNERPERERNSEHRPKVGGSSFGSDRRGGNRYEKPQGGDRFDRQDRPQRFERTERPNGGERQELSDRPERQERFGRAEGGTRFEKTNRFDRNERSQRSDRSGEYTKERRERMAKNEREYKPGERMPRHLRGAEEREERERKSFSRQVFKGNSDSYSERLDKDRKDKKPTVKPRGAAPIKIVNPNEPLRLNRFIAQSGVCSRREADELILSGEVTVNGVVVTELGSKVLRSDVVKFEGKELRGEKRVYIIMNKPKGFVTSVDDPHNDKTVMDLLKGEVPQRVYPVGRLDKYTTGVLLLTNDGDLTKELTHPSYEKSKIYHVFLDKPITEAHMDQLLSGVELEDGEIHADEIAAVGGDRKEVGIELHSGRNRIVRRMFEHVGYEVERLDRVYFAGLTKVGLRRGFWRYLTEGEVAMLKSKNYK